jgi:hypothetical protein
MVLIQQEIVSSQVWIGSDSELSKGPSLGPWWGADLDTRRVLSCGRTNDCTCTHVEVRNWAPTPMQNHNAYETAGPQFLRVAYLDWFLMWKPNQHLNNATRRRRAGTRVLLLLPLPAWPAPPPRGTGRRRRNATRTVDGGARHWRLNKQPASVASQPSRSVPLPVRRRRWAPVPVPDRQAGKEGGKRTRTGTAVEHSHTWRVRTGRQDRRFWPVSLSHVEVGSLVNVREPSDRAGSVVADRGGTGVQLRPCTACHTSRMCSCASWVQTCGCNLL